MRLVYLFFLTITALVLTECTNLPFEKSTTGVPTCSRPPCPPPPPGPCDDICAYQLISFINITYNSDTDGPTYNNTFVLVSNTQKLVLCMKNLSFDYDSRSTRYNQGSILVNVYKKSDGPSKSLDSALNSLTCPFAGLDITLKCVLLPGDQLLMQVILYNNPVLYPDNSLYVLSKLSVFAE